MSCLFHTKTINQKGILPLLTASSVEISNPSQQALEFKKEVRTLARQKPFSGASKSLGGLGLTII